MFKVPEIFRIITGELSTTQNDGNNGAFLITCSKPPLFAIASDGLGWEHVSVSLVSPNNVSNRIPRCPTWDEMAQVKGLFWGEEDCVVQYHPPLSQAVNNYPFCLHLWRQIGADFPLPPRITV